jgi:hypothetical protein
MGIQSSSLEASNAIDISPVLPAIRAACAGVAASGLALALSAPTNYFS